MITMDYLDERVLWIVFFRTSFTLRQKLPLLFTDCKISLFFVCVWRSICCLFLFSRTITHIRMKIGMIAQRKKYFAEFHWNRKNTDRHTYVLHLSESESFENAICMMMTMTMAKCLETFDSKETAYSHSNV